MLTDATMTAGNDWKGWPLLFGFSLAGLSIVAERVLFRFLAADSYQLLLCSVAISVLYVGLRAGAVALLVTAAAQWLFFLPVLNTFQSQERPSVARFVLFLTLGLLICGLGWRWHASEQKLKLLRGLLPVCAACKRIRDEQGQWQQMEIYIRDHSEADFTHGLCPECARYYRA